MSDVVLAIGYLALALAAAVVVIDVASGAHARKLMRRAEEQQKRDWERAERVGRT